LKEFAWYLSQKRFKVKAKKVKFKRSKRIEKVHKISKKNVNENLNVQK